MKQVSYYKKQSKRQRNACSFCSRSCKSRDIASRKFPKGEIHPKWKGGNPTNSNGYKLIYRPDDERSIGGKYLLEHRVIMEKHLKKRLKKTQLVHHIDGNKLNNSIRNLKILSRPSHARLHKILDNSK